MENTHINSFEKENETRGENTMRKNQIRKALIELGFEKIDGWMYTSGEGKNGTWRKQEYIIEKNVPGISLPANVFTKIPCFSIFLRSRLILRRWFELKIER